MMLLCESDQPHSAISLFHNFANSTVGVSHQADDSTTITETRVSEKAHIQSVVRYNTDRSFVFTTVLVPSTLLFRCARLHS